MCSMYSGKCDFCDSLWMSAENEEKVFERFNGTKLYVMQPLPDGVDFIQALKDGVDIPETYYKKIEYNSINDLIPLYPHLIAMAHYNNSNSIVILSSKSYADEEEIESLEYKLEQLLKIYRRCKRKKTEFNVEEAVKEVCWGDYNIEQITELANRVKEKGKKATINGIHLYMQEYYRKKLVEEMLKHGINPCDYGDYERFL